MFCKTCGRNNPDGSIMCIGCGAPLGQNMTQGGAPNMGMPGVGMSNMGTPNMGTPNMGAPMRSPFPAPNAYTPASFARPTSSRKLNLIGIVGGLIALISIFLPYAKVSFMGMSESISLFGAGGSDWIFVLLASLVGIAMSALGNPAGVVSGGVACVIIGFLENNSITDALKESGLESLSSLIDKGVGCYMLFIGGALMIAGGVYGFIQKNR